MEQGDIDDILNNVNDIWSPPVNVNNYLTEEDSDDEAPVGDINHIPVSLLNAYKILNSPEIENTNVTNKVSDNKTK